VASGDVVVATGVRPPSVGPCVAARNRCNALSAAEHCVEASLVAVGEVVAGAAIWLTLVSTKDDARASAVGTGSAVPRVFERLMEIARSDTVAEEAARLDGVTMLTLSAASVSTEGSTCDCLTGAALVMGARSEAADGLLVLASVTSVLCAATAAGTLASSGARATLALSASHAVASEDAATWLCPSTGWHMAVLPCR
jgi:hypothetical protein